MAHPQLLIGLMTGTSLDGIDAVLVDLSGAQPALLAAQGTALPASLRHDLLTLQAASPDEIDLAWRAGNSLSDCYADSVAALLEQAGVAAADIVAIGNHGQTIRHRPERGYTIQLGNHARLAERSGITVVGDFRSRDVAAGGQGAPLVPAFHHAIFADAQRHRVIVNIGGIANLTNLPRNGDVSGYDTGPGNVLMDLWIHRHRGERYDAAGAWAASGKVLDDLLARLLTEPYLALAAPKSTGRDLFHADWLDAQLAGRNDAPADVMATLTAYTARTIADAIRTTAPSVDDVFVCGGGAHNPTLLAMLGDALPGVGIASTAALGVDPDWVEAIAFAWLAQRCLAGASGNVPTVTGAAGPRVLGAIWPA
ncbi:anhydro-N-acetylmuramic acid kinase [Jeongeupia naejangsanensis]|uniref:Anhydro-N-acetylmuramic acid kinase n=1 Tax=Jeongeupia naejangsanensis TaxID=613195 RepID=A0ABS2BJ63_9NEIS|nr:anhydro-N-acetylmuramic acid kinase [Jeongeupia naejangsanensis]MBM3115653.1 anhydro-N-acetylmuramic acid kinase [Jeongeupia naejangsanensis]